MAPINSMEFQLRAITTEVKGLRIEVEGVRTHLSSATDFILLELEKIAQSLGTIRKHLNAPD